MHTKTLSRLLLLTLIAATVVSAQTARHPLKLDDLARFRNVSDPQISPDGQWIAYTSNESRRREIYVAPFPGPGAKRQISNSGGSQPKWRGDGKEILYLAVDNKLMAAEVNGQGGSLEVGAVRALFEIRPRGPSRSVYDTVDGQRFLVMVNTAVEQKSSSPITLVLNWMTDLKQ